METASTESRTAIRELRTMIMEIAPPDLDRGGLDGALVRLVAVAQEARPHGEARDRHLGREPPHRRRRPRLSNGHVGLSLLQEGVVEAGAGVAIVPAPGGGATIRLQLAKS